MTEQDKSIIAMINRNVQSKRVKVMIKESSMKEKHIFSKKRNEGSISAPKQKPRKKLHVEKTDSLGTKEQTNCHTEETISLARLNEIRQLRVKKDYSAVEEKIKQFRENTKAPSVNRLDILEAFNKKMREEYAIRKMCDEQDEIDAQIKKKEEDERCARERQDYIDDAIKQYQSDTANGSGFAMIQLAKEYSYGTEDDLKKAIELYQKIINLGEGGRITKDNICYALIELAFYYYQGRGVEKNWEKSVELYWKAIDLGSIDAMCDLARHYHRSIDKNYQKAIELYQKAVNLGCYWVMCDLAECYMKKVERLHRSEDHDMQIIATEHITKAGIMYAKCLIHEDLIHNVPGAESGILEIFRSYPIEAINILAAQQREITSLKEEQAKSNEMIEHLKLYPGTDYREALKDFELLQCTKGSNHALPNV